MIQPRIVYEDESLLVIDKPAGMVVNRASTVREGESLQDWIETRHWFSRQKKADLTSYFLARSGIVHRLDKETSGLLVVAKTALSFSELQAQFARREVKKTYLVLVHGFMQPKEGSVCLPLARSRRVRERFSVAVVGRRAETRWHVVGNYYQCTDPLVRSSWYHGFSLSEIEPQTGRTHQIRVHLSFLGHPVVSDERYGGRRAGEDRKWCPRQFLHAFRISITHPELGKQVWFEAQLPADLKKALTFLK